MKTNYPHTVQEWLNDFYSYLNKEGFFIDHQLGECDEETTKNNFDEIIGNEALQSWLVEGEVMIEPNEVGNLLFQVIVKSHIQELKRDGIVDSIEDVNGEEIIWVTPKGKKTTKLD
tara:strand:- start:5607 stop:5954 length:348 start_codon:yes stop_codon:yes gene_type:complete